MIKLISKRRLAFRNPEDGSFVAVMPQVFETVPDWAAKDPIFRWGVEDGTIQTVDQKIIKAEPEKVEKNTPEKADEVSEEAEKVESEVKAEAKPEKPKKVPTKGKK